MEGQQENNVFGAGYSRLAGNSAPNDLRKYSTDAPAPAADRDKVYFREVIRQAEEPSRRWSASDMVMHEKGRDHLQELVDQLHALAAHLQSVREEERISIAREVHDELGQALTALKMDVAWVRKHVGAEHNSDSPCPIEHRLNVMSRLLDDTTDIARKIANQLRPAVLDTLGLLPALHWQIRVFTERSGLKVQTAFTVDSVELCPACETAVFRIVQEALTNVARHSQATHVKVCLHAEGGCARLEVEDNGVGIQPRKPGERHSMGLLGMRERAMVFGGEVSIFSPAGGGATVSIQFPTHCAHAR